MDWTWTILLRYLIASCVWRIFGGEGKSAKLVLYAGVRRRYEINANKCKAGVFLLKPMKFTCACVTGVWGFYTKYCKEPYKIIGGDHYCFHLEDTDIKFSQVILFGHPTYPLEPSLTHFREKYIMMTKSYVGDDDTVEMDASSSFLSVTDTSWTIIGNTGDKLCLKDTSYHPTGHNDPKHKFCLFDPNPKNITKRWKEIHEIQRGCTSSAQILRPTSCQKIHQANEESICKGIKPTTQRSVSTSSTIWSTTLSSKSTTQLTSTPTTELPTTTTIMSTTMAMSSASNTPSTTTTILTDTSTISTTSTTTEMSITTTQKPCPDILSREDVKKHWSSARELSCSNSITQISFKDQLKRFAIYGMNKLIKTRQNSLVQIEQLVKLQRDLLKLTCPAHLVSPTFIDSVTEAFFTFIREDFFYGVEEMEQELFQRVTVTLLKCLKRAKPFKFVEEKEDCNITKITGRVIIQNDTLPIIIEEKHAWKNYEPLIESGWKMFLNVYAYCYEDFFRQNDHHSYAVRMMQLFSNFIYEKWIQPFEFTPLYKFIVPNVKHMELTMTNLDYCVGAGQHVSSIPVWLDRNTLELDLWPNQADNYSFRNKRSIWINHLGTNRESTEIWDGTAYCLRTPEDPSFHLNFGRCAHP